MESTELNKLHEIDYETMKVALDIFKEHDLSYFLIAGTLLGAIRHQGFIPWDDDMDIGVPRVAYEQFLDKYSKELPERYKVENFKTSVSSKYYITRILDTQVTVKELRDGTETCASIDLFPIDGTPNNTFLRKLFVGHIMFLRMLISISQSDNIDMSRKRQLWEKIIIITAKKIPFNKIINRKKVFFELDRILSRYSFEKSEYVGSLMGAYRSKELFKKSFVNELIKVKFEDAYFYAPRDWDGYLKSMYGEYMQIPPIESIKAKRHFKILEGAEKSV